MESPSMCCESKESICQDAKRPEQSQHPDIVPTAPVTQPSRNVICQAWRDYKLGRQLRKESAQQRRLEEVRLRSAAAAAAEHATRGAQQQSQSQPQQQDVITVDPSKRVRPNGKPGWQAQRGGDYPWRIERTIQGDTTWRGTWILEVKDIFEVSWNEQKVHDGNTWRWMHLPGPPHWPLEVQSQESSPGPSAPSSRARDSKQKKKDKSA